MEFFDPLKFSFQTKYGYYAGYKMCCLKFMSLRHANVKLTEEQQLSKIILSQYSWNHILCQDCAKKLIYFPTVRISDFLDIKRRNLTQQKEDISCDDNYFVLIDFILKHIKTETTDQTIEFDLNQTKQLLQEQQEGKKINKHQQISEKINFLRFYDRRDLEKTLQNQTEKKGCWKTAKLREFFIQLINIERHNSTDFDYSDLPRNMLIKILKQGKQKIDSYYTLLFDSEIS